MKTIYLARHAKSSWKDAGTQDWQRPLLLIGMERAQKVAMALRKKNIHPEKIISSHAFRALNTAVIFSLELDYPLEEISISKGIYEKSSLNILNLIKKQNDTFSSLMLFGHNPSIMDLYMLLTGDKISNFSTSTVAGIQFNAKKWNEIQSKQGKCIIMETGK